MIKLLFVVTNFYNRYKTSTIIKSPKMQRMGGEGIPPPPLKCLPANFCQPRNAPLPQTWAGQKLGLCRNDRFWYVPKFLIQILQTYNTELTKYECQYNTIAFNVLMRAAKGSFFQKTLSGNGGSPPPLTESVLCFSGNFFPKRTRNDVFVLNKGGVRIIKMEI